MCQNLSRRWYQSDRPPSVRQIQKRPAGRAGRQLTRRSPRMYRHPRSSRSQTNAIVVAAVSIIRARDNVRALLGIASANNEAAPAVSAKNALVLIGDLVGGCVREQQPSRGIVPWDQLLWKNCSPRGPIATAPQRAPLRVHFSLGLRDVGTPWHNSALCVGLRKRHHQCSPGPFCCQTFK